MALTWSEVRAWRGDPLQHASSALSKQLDALLQLNDDVTALTPQQWTGTAADAAGQQRTGLIRRLGERVSEVAAARTLLDRAADAVLGVHDGTLQAQAFADGNGLQITPDGRVTDDTLVGRVFPTQHDADVAMAQRTLVVDECQARIDQVLRTAADIDADLCAALRTIMSGRVGGDRAGDLAAAAALGDAAGRADVDLPPPPGGPGAPGDPAANAGWWATLSSTEKQQVIREHPGWIGNRDGIDATARDQAKRILLPAYQQALRTRQATLKSELGALNPLSPTAPLEIGKLRGELDQVNDKLASLDTVARILDAHPDRQLLLLDLTHERAEAAIAVGDVGTAKHVAVFTPGLTSTVQGMKDNDTSMDKLRDTAERILKRNNSSDTVATVTWLGYQAPQTTMDSLLSSNSVGLPGAAQDGGASLSQFLQGINASRTTPADLTALGHSYGSTTLGYALTHDTGVSRAAVFGSPGLPVHTVDGLRLTGGHVWAESAPGDLVGSLGRFGPVPTHLPGVTELSTAASTADGTPLAGIGGHPYRAPLHDLIPLPGPLPLPNPFAIADAATNGSALLDNHTHYLDPNTTSQYNLAALVAGQTQAAVPAPPPQVPSTAEPLPTSAPPPGPPTLPPIFPAPFPGPAPLPPHGATRTP